MKEKIIAEYLISWFRVNKRDLPWRGTNDPYKIWLSEIILQQTRVAQGLPYFEKFRTSFETIFDLANASETQVLKCWEGLGYYSRARNLHVTAKYIVSELKGEFPKNYESLLKLKGVGNYTAAAIASFAYNEKVAVLDGNVMRVLARIYGYEGDISELRSRNELQKLADSIIPNKVPGLFNQAIMEFGALHCTPINPSCFKCGLSKLCDAYAMKKQDILPIKSKKIKVKERFFNYLVIKNKTGEIFFNQRKKGDIWEGLYDFLLVETESECLQFDKILPFIKFKIIFLSVSNSYKHILTHQRIFAKFWIVELPEEKNIPVSLQKFTLKEASQLPRPILIKNFFDKQILM
jgi:A/G-specific adenine glycosylase